MIPMIDLHTHILPGMDDGAPDIKTALQMLMMEAKQGVRTVALTPHFYRTREHVSDFLQRRAYAMGQLQNVLKGKKHPRLVLAAEVAYVPGIADWQELEQLCYAGTKILLIEPPMTAWNEDMFRQLYSIEGRRGITPMIAHIDRYFETQKKTHIEQLLEMGFPIQVSTAALMKFMSRRRAVKLLTEYNGVLVTDCHNTAMRPPDIANALQVLQKKRNCDIRKILEHANEIETPCI